MLKTRRFKIWSTLYNRFELEPYSFPVVEPVLSKAIIPITNVDDILAEYGAVLGVVNVTGTGISLPLTVPADEFWEVYSIHFELATGTYTFNYVILRDVAAGQNCKIETMTATAEHVVDTHGQTFPLKPGDQLGVNVNAHTGAGNLNCVVWRKKLTYLPEES